MSWLCAQSYLLQNYALTKCCDIQSWWIHAYWQITKQRYSSHDAILKSLYSRQNREHEERINSWHHNTLWQRSEMFYLEILVLRVPPTTKSVIIENSHSVWTRYYPRWQINKMVDKQDGKWTRWGMDGQDCMQQDDSQDGRHKEPHHGRHDKQTTWQTDNMLAKMADTRYSPSRIILVVMAVGSPTVLAIAE